MAKPLFQDIIPPDKRSIKQVPIPQRGGRRTDETARRLKVPDDEQPGLPEKPARSRASSNLPASSAPAPVSVRARRAEEVEDDKPISPSRRVPFYEERDPYRRRFSWRIVVVLVCAVVIIVGTYFTLSHYAKATIIVTPQTESITLNNQFVGTSLTASTTASSSSARIPYELIAATKDGSMSVAATGQTTLITKASGQITIFNDYSTSPQKLISGTRFSTPSGLIYRIGSAVTVPGKSGSIPGSVTVTVTADQAGDQYNVGLSDFVVPGLSGSQAYKDIYARSETPMTGGFSGIEPEVDPASLAAAQATIDAELEGALLEAIRQQTPSNEIVLPNAYVISYQHLATTAASSSQATVNEEGTIHAFAFDSTQLADAVALTGASSSPVSVGPTAIVWQLSNPTDLQFNLNIASSSAAAPETLSTLPFTLSGTANLTAFIDTQEIKENLEGKSKNDLNPILNDFPGVTKATLSLEPFWQQDLPTDPDNINVEVTN